LAHTTSPQHANEETMLTPQEDTRAAWDEIAAGYDEFVTAPGMPSAEDGLRRAGIRAGMRVLDVACGSGALSIPAARLGAQVLAVDQSPKMLERLQARAREEALSSIQCRVMDGTALQLEDGSFDIAASQFGVMLFADMPRGISEMARVTRPGGRVLMIVYDAPQKLDFFAFFVAAIRAAVPDFTGPPHDPPPLPFQLQDPARLRSELANAGLKDIRVEPGAEKLTLHSGKALWDWLVNSNPIVGDVLTELELTQEQLQIVQGALERGIRERAGGTGPAVLSNPLHIGIGWK
jgi:ubiquinone/menaquinone biosynthesis C-methylase UbiE